jgi:hypothetical protein
MMLARFSFCKGVNFAAIQIKKYFSPLSIPYLASVIEKLSIDFISTVFWGFSIFFFSVSFFIF